MTTATPEAPVVKTQKKSPPVPSRNLEDCLADAKAVYTSLGHNSFQRTEMASVLGIAADSGPTSSRLYSIRAYGLIDVASDGSCKITDQFHNLDNAENGGVEFKRLALEAIKRNQIFAYLFSEFPTKLPSTQIIAKRLELSKKFPPAKATEIASVFEECVRFSGVVDSSGNILPIREVAQERKDEGAKDAQGTDAIPANIQTEKKNLLKLDIPIGNQRVITVLYPHDMTADEATKAGKVLSAVAG